MDISASVRRKIMDNQIDAFFTSVEDLIFVWQYRQARLKSCHTPPTAQKEDHTQTGETPTTRHMSVARHAHGRRQNASISSMNELHDYLSAHTDKVTFAKNNLSPYVSPFLDAVTLARVTGDLGINGRVIPKVINGRQYIAFSGYPGLRNIFTGPIYKVDNIKIVNMAIGTRGIAKSIAKGAYLTILITIPLTVVESMLKAPGDLYVLFGNVASELIKIGIPALIAAIMGIGMTGSAILASLPMGVAIAIGVGTGFILNSVDKRYKLTERLIEGLKGLEVKAQGTATSAGNGVWNTLRAGGLGMGGGYRR